MDNTPFIPFIPVNQSPTPRTDAVFWKFHTHDDIVNLARDLERELNKNMELMNSGKQTDTPRTDAAKSYWDSAERENCVSIVLARELELEAVTYKNEALSLRDSHDLLYRDYQKLEAEVERLREQLASTKQLAIKFWEALEENGFKLELPK
jgi:hypothetical protein